MAESHVITGLVSKRSELSGQIDQLQAQIKQIKADLSAIDQAIKVFNPDYDLRSIKGRRRNKKNSFFASGEGNTMLMDIIRESQGTITTNEIADIVIQRKGFNQNSLDMRALKACIFTILKRLQKREIIRQIEGVDGREKYWSRF